MAQAVEAAISNRIREIDNQLEALIALQEEREKLSQFLLDLNADRRPRSSARGAATRRGRGDAPKRGTDKTAPARRPGAQAAVIAFLDQHAESSAAQIAEATGFDRNLVYSILSRLASKGRIERLIGEGGVKAYRIRQ